MQICNLALRTNYTIGCTIPANRKRAAHANHDQCLRLHSVSRIPSVDELIRHKIKAWPDFTRKLKPRLTFVACAFGPFAFFFAGSSNVAPSFVSPSSPTSSLHSSYPMIQCNNSKTNNITIPWFRGTTTNTFALTLYQNFNIVSAQSKRSAQPSPSCASTGGASAPSLRVVRPSDPAAIKITTSKSSTCFNN